MLPLSFSVKADGELSLEQFGVVDPLGAFGMSEV
jgi:hypothetical protein